MVGRHTVRLILTKCQESQRLVPVVPGIIASERTSEKDQCLFRSSGGAKVGARAFVLYKYV